jgi:hypothetical protein
VDREVRGAFESSRAHRESPRIAGFVRVCGIIRDVDKPRPPAAQRCDRDADADKAARVEMLLVDAAHSLGENLEQADALISAAFELADGFAAAQR